MRLIPELSGPFPIHARALDQDKENPAYKQDDGQDEARLQDVVEPEVLSEVEGRGQVLHTIDNQKVKKVDAITHAANGGDHRVAEDGGENPAPECAEIQDNDQKGQHDVTDVPAHKPYERPQADCRVPDKGCAPLSACEVEIAD